MNGIFSNLSLRGRTGGAKKKGARGTLHAALGRWDCCAEPTSQANPTNQPGQRTGADAIIVASRNNN